MSKFIKAALLLTLIGIAVTLYLTYTHYADQQVACPETGVICCSCVLNSQYANLLGVPLGIWGLGFFIIEAFVLLKGNADMRVIYNGIGLAFVFYFFWVEYTVQHICIYCTTVHALVIALLALSILFYKEGPGGKGAHR